jgi:hypothetical protein
MLGLSLRVEAFRSGKLMVYPPVFSEECARYLESVGYKNTKNGSVQATHNIGVAGGRTSKLSARAAA